MHREVRCTSDGSLSKTSSTSESNLECTVKAAVTKASMYAVFGRGRVKADDDEVLLPLALPRGLAVEAEGAEEEEEEVLPMRTASSASFAMAKM